MEDKIISSTKESKKVNIIAGTNIIAKPITLNIEPNKINPTVFVINYTDNGVKPTGNNVKVYKLGAPNMIFPLLGSPIVDDVKKTLTVTVDVNALLSSADEYVVEFEIIKG